LLLLPGVVNHDRLPAHLLPRDGEIAAFNACVNQFQNDTDPVVREFVGKALINKGISLRNHGKNAEAAGAFDECVEFCKNEEAEIFKNLAADAASFKAALPKGE